MDREYKNVIVSVFNKTRTVSQKPVLLYSINFQTKSASEGYVFLRNGESDSSEQKLFIRIGADQSYNQVFNVPVFFSRGLRMQFGGNFHSATVQYSEVGK